MICLKCGSPIVTGEDERLAVCADCGAIHAEGKVVGRTPFRVGMQANDVVHIMRKTGRTHMQEPHPLNASDPMEVVAKPDLLVEWNVSCGARLVLGRNEGQAGKPFCVLKLDFPALVGDARGDDEQSSAN